MVLLIFTNISETFLCCPLPISKANNPLEMYQCDALTIPSNCAGIPGISVPAGFTNTGLPVGLQLLAPHFSEGKLFSAAQVIENEFKCFSQVPSL